MYFDMVFFKSQQSFLIYSDILSSFVEQQIYICIESRLVCNQKLIDSGFLTIRDLIDSNGALREIREPLRSILSPVDHFLPFSLATALSKEWRRVLRMNETPDPINQEFGDLNRFSLFLEGKK